MRTKFLKDLNGKVKFEHDDDWPRVIVQFSASERVVYAVDGQRLILQHRHRSPRSDKWSTWRSVWGTKSHEEMRKLMEKSDPFACDSEKLDSICLKTDDGDYVEHSR
ncbi:hypothetical protein [Rhizobium mongolense]|uniref:Uncharacterized protein n=1 Tax=Rhizobium mongolense TaxID=57676 RepID=A0A7W6RWM9_9HYPH|nr:hypothetical protein [Rhizobium mongolense]MBB4279303.1 hypothetical protein [Rhizobium mongolense]